MNHLTFKDSVTEKISATAADGKNSTFALQKSFENMLCTKYDNLEFIYENDGIMLGTMELAINLTK